MQSITFDARKLMCVFAAITILLILAGFVVIYIKANYDTQFFNRSLDMFDLNRENNLPTWYASFSFIVCAAASWMLSTNRCHSSYSVYWKTLAFIFLAMSLDEAASMHEYVASLLKGQFTFTGYWYFAWVIPAVILIITGIFYFFRFWWNLPQPTKITLAAGAVIFFCGAVGMEIIGGNMVEQEGFNNPSYMFLTLAEETMELTGTYLFLYSLLGLLAAERHEQRLLVTTSAVKKEVAAVKMAGY